MGAAARQRQYRQRRASGIRVVRVEVDSEFIEMLIDAGYLPAWDAEDPANIDRAVAKLFARLKVIEP